MQFKDHFSQQASEYHLYRPQYPSELFEYLASIVPHHDLAWDCATGNGQAAMGLTPYFRRIIATDASGKQLAHTTPHEKIIFQIAQAEKTSLTTATVDLVVVAQALHWFDFEKFYAEVRRVLRPEGILAIWAYNLAIITPAIDAVVNRFYHGIVGQHWPPERKHIEKNYQTIPFPFDEISAPQFTMQAEWTQEHLFGYLSTWSSVQRYKVQYGVDPIDLIRDDLVQAWEDNHLIRKVSWPLILRIGKNQ